MIDPRYRVIAVDETHNWDASITSIVGRIAGVYVVNFAEVTHLCSLDGSYYGQFLCNITEHYVREPDGYDSGRPVWDMDWAAEWPEDFARSVALETAWNAPYHGIQYENGGETGTYFGRLAEPDNSLIDMSDWDEDTDSMDEDEADEYRLQRDRAAFDAACEYMNNGEEWADIAPWAKEPAE